MFAFSSFKKRRNKPTASSVSLLKKYGYDRRKYGEFIISVNSDSVEHIKVIKGLPNHKVEVLGQYTGWTQVDNSSWIYSQKNASSSQQEEECALSQHSQFHEEQQRLTRNWILFVHDITVETVVGAVDCASKKSVKKRKKITKKRFEHIFENHCVSVSKENKRYRDVQISLSPPSCEEIPGWTDCWQLKHKSILANSKMPLQEGSFYRRYLKEHGFSGSCVHSKTVKNHVNKKKEELEERDDNDASVMKEKHTFFEMIFDFKTVVSGSDFSAYVDGSDINLFYDELFSSALALRLKYNFLHLEISCSRRGDLQSLRLSESPIGYILKKIKLVLSLDRNMWANPFMRVWRDYAKSIIEGESASAKKGLLFHLFCGSMADGLALKSLTKCEYQGFKRQKCSEITCYVRGLNKTTGIRVAPLSYSAWECRVGADSDCALTLNVVRHGLFGFVPCIPFYLERSVFEVYCLFTVQYTEFLEVTGAIDADTFSVPQFFREDPKSLWSWCDMCSVQEEQQALHAGAETARFQDVKEKRYILTLTVLGSRQVQSKTSDYDKFNGVNQNNQQRIAIEMPLHSLLMRIQRNINPRILEFFQKGQGILFQKPSIH